jgi:basic membrane lipoprotein Med (substrate-binding protein (PBP1-ABC) superfamily)
MCRGLGIGVLLAFLGCSAAGDGTDGAFRVALVTPGSIADASWNAGAYQGLLLIRDSLAARVSQVEARTPSDQEEALRTYAAQGYPLIFAHGFEFQDAAERVAASYPEAIIVITSGQRVSGKTNKIGYVGGIELPPVRMAYEAWSRGAKSVNPLVESRGTYLNNFDDAVAGREAALAMIRLGVDMLHHNADAAGLGVFQAAKENPGVFVFGSNADQAGVAPQQVLGSAVIDLPGAFLAVAREVAEGRFIPRVESFGLESGVIKYVANPALAFQVSAEVMARVREAEAAIISGTLEVADRETGQVPPGER